MAEDSGDSYSGTDKPPGVVGYLRGAGLPDSTSNRARAQKIIKKSALDRQKSPTVNEFRRMWKAEFGE